LYIFILLSLLILGLTVFVIESILKVNNLVVILLWYFPALILIGVLVFVFGFSRLGIDSIIIVGFTIIFTCIFHILFKFCLRFYEEYIQNTTNIFKLIAILPVLLVFINVLFTYIYWCNLVILPEYTNTPISVDDENVYIVETTARSLFDLFYFAFSVSFSLPMNDSLEAVQHYIISSTYLRIIQILHIIFFKSFELIIIGITLSKLIEVLSNKKPLEVISIDGDNYKQVSLLKN
jgi:hypothetical protein